MRKISDFTKTFLRVDNLRRTPGIPRRKRKLNPSSERLARLEKPRRKEPYHEEIVRKSLLEEREERIIKKSANGEQ